MMRLSATSVRGSAVGLLLTLGLGIGHGVAQEPLPDGTATATATADGRQVLNLKNADINVLIATVAEITGKNFIVDPRVEGKVTVITSEPMTPDEVYHTFLSVLRINGFAAVPNGRLIRIVPDAIARQFDVPPEVPGTTDSNTIVTRVLVVNNVPARELAELLKPLLPQAAQVSVHESSNAIVIADRAGNIDRVERLVRRIDTAGDDQVEVIALRHANATELARTLGGVSEGDRGPRLVADGRTNSLLLTGDRRGRLRLRTLIAHLDTPLESGDTTQVVYLHYAAANDLVPVLSSLAKSLEGAEGGENAVSGTSIQAHESTNSLVISAPSAVMDSLRSVIRQLDIRRAQVLIEAVIAEVAEEKAKEFGIQWQAVPGDNGELGRGVFGGTNFSGPNGGNIIGALSDPFSLPGGLNLGWLDGTITVPGPNGRDITILNMGALVRALNADAGTNILSTPSIVTLDNQEAVLEVGQEVPFIQGEFTTPVASGGSGTGSSGSLVNPFRTLERKSIGLKLKVTPQINAGDAVVLTLEQELSSLAPQVQGAADLITNQRIIKTTVLVGDGQMLVLGGLVTEDQGERVNMVPGLGRIPVLGNLFKYRSSNRVRRNLMVFLRPVILRDGQAETAISGNRYNYIRGEQLRMRDQSDGLLKPEEKPVLPELDAVPGPGVIAPMPLPEPEPASDGKRRRRGR